VTIFIVGAGMAGLLAANMLQRHKPVVLERAAELPNNHSAVLRFRGTAVADVLGIPFKRVTVIKDSVPWRNPVADALAYSQKNTGVARSDRSITAGLTVAERYIAPADLIERMAAGIDIRYGHDFGASLPSDRITDLGGAPTISTIPMPVLMELLDWPHRPVLSSSPAVNVRATVKDCDAYVTLNVPDPKIEFSRVSLTGNELIVEVPRATQVRPGDASYATQAAALLGIAENRLSAIQAHASPYAKILPINDDERKQFIYEASTKHGIYSLGRFATWRPGLLLDDLVQDIRKIEGWINGQSHYDMTKGRG
jgi:hypothetical protein